MRLPARRPPQLPSPASPSSRAEDARAPRRPPRSTRPKKGPEPLGRLFGEMMSHLNRRSAGDTLQMMSEHGLSMAQMVTMHSLEHHTVQSVSRIAENLRLSLPATSHLVERLVRAGFVVRTEDPDDRRAKRVALTAQGSTFIRKVEAARTREVSQVFDHLSADARRRLSETLAFVVEELARLPLSPPRTRSRSTPST